MTSCVLHWCLPGGKNDGDRRSPHDDRDWSLRSPGLLPGAGRSVGSATRATDFRTDRHCVVAPLRPCADAPGRDRPGRAGFGAQRLPGDRDAGGSSRRPAGGGRDAGDRPAGRECGDGARPRLADAQRVARGGRPQLRVRLDGRRAGDAAGRHHGAAGVGRRRVQAPARPDRCGRQDRGGGVAEQLDLAVRRRPGAGRPRCDRRGRALPAGWAVLPEPTCAGRVQLAVVCGRTADGDDPQGGCRPHPQADGRRPRRRKADAARGRRTVPGVERGRVPAGTAAGRADRGRRPPRRLVPGRLRQRQRRCRDAGNGPRHGGSRRAARAHDLLHIANGRGVRPGRQRVRLVHGRARADRTLAPGVGRAQPVPPVRRGIRPHRAAAARGGAAGADRLGAELPAGGRPAGPADQRLEDVPARLRHRALAAAGGGRARRSAC